MSVTGLCQICERRDAEFQCGRCGTLACPTHYEAGLGLCTDCASGATRSEAEGDDHQGPGREDTGGTDTRM